MTGHSHIVVSPGNGQFYCLSCGNKLSAYEANGALPEALALEQEKLERQSGELNSTYCWEHSNGHIGGWTCHHPDCKA